LPAPVSFQPSLSGPILPEPAPEVTPQAPIQRTAESLPPAELLRVELPSMATASAAPEPAVVSPPATINLPPLRTEFADMLADLRTTALRLWQWVRTVAAPVAVAVMAMAALVAMLAVLALLRAVGQVPHGFETHIRPVLQSVAAWVGGGFARGFVVLRAGVATANAAVSTVAAPLVKPIFVAGRIAAVVLPAAALCAAVGLTPVSFGVRTTEESVTIPVARAVAPAPASAPLGIVAASAMVPSNVKMVTPPPMAAVCEEQTWPYVTERCLATRNGLIDLPVDPEISAMNATRNAMASTAMTSDDASAKPVASVKPKVKRKVRERRRRR
jgi:hypothetical protein